MTDIEDTLKKFIKRDDIDIILINQNVSTGQGTLEIPKLLIRLLYTEENIAPRFFSRLAATMVINVIIVICDHKSHVSKIWMALWLCR